VCAAASDARRALDICRGALELVLAQLEDEEAAGRDGSAGGIGTSALAVTVPVMAKAVAALFKSHVVELCASLPHHQQMFLCAAVLHFRDAAAAAAEAAPRPHPLALASGKVARAGARAGPTTMRRLHSAYATLCREQQMRPISASEIVPVCQAIASSGLLHIAPAGSAKGGALESHVSIAIHEEELQLAVREVRIFRTILQQRQSE
jgi:cell division control protein 6